MLIFEGSCSLVLHRDGLPILPSRQIHARPYRLIIFFTLRYYPSRFSTFFLKLTSFLAICVAFPMKSVSRFISLEAFYLLFSLRKLPQVPHSDLLSHIVPLGTLDPLWFALVYYFMQAPQHLGFLVI